MPLKRALKTILDFTPGAISLLLLIVLLFMHFSPQFGGKMTAAERQQYEQLDHFDAGKFRNYEDIKLALDFKSITTMLKEVVTSIPNTTPDQNLEVRQFDLAQLNQGLGNKARLTWMSHSSFLLEMEGQVIMIDPMFSAVPAPYAWMGRKRFNDTMSFKLADLKSVDAIIISHDHYDHLDYASIQQLKDKVKRVIVPLGVGRHFRAWGVDAGKIEELDWWAETQLGNTKVACTPARHGSGRGIADQNTSLWSSWCFIGDNQKIYFSGDGGYGKHFREIGEQYGPFDFAMVECGQYDVKWADIHMVPEQSMQAGLDVQAACLMPIHWGAFRLANHIWTDPVQRFSTRAAELGATIATPEIGESILIPSEQYPTRRWWEKYGNASSQ